MRFRIVMTTTHAIDSRMPLTKEDLENSAVSISTDRPVALTVEHDRTLPPFGKTFAASVEPADCGEYKLVGEVDLFEKRYAVALPYGSIALALKSEFDDRPFADTDSNVPEGLHINYDSDNFETIEDENSFLDVVRREGVVADGNTIRHSVLNDPQVVVSLSKGTIIFLLAKPILGKVSKDLVTLYEVVRDAAISLARNAFPVTKLITYIFRLCGEPTVELAIRTRDAERVMSAISENNLRLCLKEAGQYRFQYQAVMVQFLFAEDDKWNFNYLLTDTGGVISTRISISRLDRQIELTLQSAQKNEQDALEKELPVVETLKEKPYKSGSKRSSKKV